MTKYIDLCDTCVNLETTHIEKVPIINKYGHVCGQKEVMVKYCSKKYQGLKGIRKFISKCKHYNNTFFCPKCNTANTFKAVFCIKCKTRFVKSYG